MLQLKGIEGELVKDFDWDTARKLIITERNNFLNKIS